MSRISDLSLVEAVGSDLGSNVVEVEHVDVFEGTDRTLVAPTYNSLLPNNAIVTTVDPGFNRFMNAWDYGGQNQALRMGVPDRTGSNGIPIRLHVVGSVVAARAASLTIPGNNFATVVAGDNVKFTVSQVTRGRSTTPAREITPSCCRGRSTRKGSCSRSSCFTSRFRSGSSNPQ